MNRAQDILLGERIVVCDGAMGTMLHSSGVSLSQSFDQMNISRPEAVSAIHQAYVDAGADIIETNTFGANRVKLGGHGLAGSVADINIAGSHLAREAAGSRALVAGSVGPTGKLLHPLGPLTFDDAYDAFVEQISNLCEGGVDLLIIETMQDLREMKAAILAARNVCDKPIVCQMSFAQEGRTIMGTDPATAAAVLEGFSPTLLGTNCGTGPQDMLEAVRAMSSVSRLGVSAQPNAGLPTFHDGRLMYLSTPEYLADFARQFVEAGAVLVGGCCGTTPEHTHALVESMRGMKRAPRRGTDTVKLAARSRVVEFGAKPILIGNRLAGIPRGSSIQHLQKEIDAQIGHGASAICINCDLDIEGSQIDLVQTSSDVALCLTGSDSSLIERALRQVEGRAMVGSSEYGKALPLAAQYGAVLVTDAVGQTPEERLRSARQVLETVEKHGLGRADIVIRSGDLPTVRAIKSELGLCTLVECGAGVSDLKKFIEAGVGAIVGDPAVIGEVA